ncbi:MAG: ATP-binding protein [Calditrichaeota bacterium]|nr:MAG: ATP-binding protein [Calditrichota bacterium]
MRFLFSVNLKFFILSLSFISALYAKPLDWTVFSILSPTVYAYPSRDSILVVTSEGYLYSIAIDQKSGKKVIFAKQDSIPLGVDNIKWAGWDSQFLYLVSDKGLFRWKKGKGISLWSHSPPQFLAEFQHRYVYVLFHGKVTIFAQGRLVSEFSVPSSTFFVEMVNDSLIAVFSNKRVDIRLSSGEIKYTVWNHTLHPQLLWKAFRSHLIYFTPKLCAIVGDTVVLSPGYRKTSNEITSSKSLLLFYSISKNDTVGRAWIKGKTVRMWPLTSLNIVVSAPFDFGLGNFHLIHLGNFSDKEITLLTNIELFPLYNDYLICFSLGAGYSIFRFNNPQYRFKNQMPSRYSIAIPVFRKDLNGDNIPDLVLLGSSSWDNIEERVYEVSILQNSIPTEINHIYQLINQARNLNNFMDCEKALLLMDKALSSSHYLLPESTQQFMTLRMNIFNKVKQKRWVKSTLQRIEVNIPWILSLVFLIALFLNLRRKFDENRSIPSAETLNFLQGGALFHKLSTTLETLLSSIEQDDWNNVAKIRHELDSFLKYLLQKKVRYEFLNAPRRWRKFYWRLFFNLLYVVFLLSKAKWIYRFGPFRRISLKQLKSGKKRLIALKLEFRKLIEGAKADVITAALLPAIDEVQQKLNPTHVIFKTQIQVEFPYRYFPDEILKFHKAFCAILENAVESFGEPHSSGKTKNRIQIRANSSMEQLNIIIEDNGKGIPPEILNKIFIPGFSYGKSGEDRGYGLSGVKTFFSKYGDICVQSIPNKGTKFHIQLLFGKIPAGA